MVRRNCQRSIFQSQRFLLGNAVAPPRQGSFLHSAEPRRTLSKSFFLARLRARCDADTRFTRQVWEDQRDLIVSFDGGNAFRPWKIKPEWSTDGGWWHVDQVQPVHTVHFAHRAHTPPEFPSRFQSQRTRVCSGPRHLLRRHR